MFDRSRLALLLALAGCNQIYGLDPTRLDDTPASDLDRDGIADDDDPCIAPMRDGDDDLDEDGVVARDDRCPFSASTLDDDADGIPDECDPFPKALGDTLACYMSFGSTEINGLVWTPRDATMDWTSREGELYTRVAGPVSGVVATLDFVAGAQTTFEAAISLDNASPSGIFAFRLWGRAGMTASEQDIGCEISGDASSTRVAVVRGNDNDQAAVTELQPFPKSRLLRLRLVLGEATGTANVRCELLDWLQSTPTARAQIALPPGRVAFGTENLQAHVSAFAIYTRASPAAL
ncbi:MAG TPA: hypothetical protein VFO79_16180 [Xanthomonadales bacterium]|nr:hypothetical protein [Xanthomonadales bacterium]